MSTTTARIEVDGYADTIKITSIGTVKLCTLLTIIYRMET